MSPLFLTIDDIMRILSISRSTFERLRKSNPNGVCVIAYYGVEPPFPPPDINAGRRLLWFRTTATDWLKTMEKVQANARASLDQQTVSIS